MYDPFDSSGPPGLHALPRGDHHIWHAVNEIGHALWPGTWMPEFRAKVPPDEQAELDWNDTVYFARIKKPGVVVQGTTLSEHVISLHSDDEIHPMNERRGGRWAILLSQLQDNGLLPQKQELPDLTDSERRQIAGLVPGLAKAVNIRGMRCGAEHYAEMMLRRGYGEPSLWQVHSAAFTPLMSGKAFENNYGISWVRSPLGEYIPDPEEFYSPSEHYLKPYYGSMLIVAKGSLVQAYRDWRKSKESKNSCAQPAASPISAKEFITRLCKLWPAQYAHPSSNILIPVFKKHFRMGRDTYRDLKTEVIEEKAMLKSWAEPGVDGLPSMPEDQFDLLIESILNPTP